MCSIKSNYTNVYTHACGLGKGSDCCMCSRTKQQLRINGLLEGSVRNPGGGLYSSTGRLRYGKQ